MNKKQKIRLRYYINTEVSDYNVRSKVVEKHIQDVYPEAKTIMRYDSRLQRYQTDTIIHAFISGFTTEIIKTLARIINGVLQTVDVTCYIGISTPFSITGKSKEDRSSWYIDAGQDEEDLIEGVN